MFASFCTSHHYSECNVYRPGHARFAFNFSDNAGPVPYCATKPRAILPTMLHAYPVFASILTPLKIHPYLYRILAREWIGSVKSILQASSRVSSPFNRWRQMLDAPH